jgi:hypothetical protein
MSRFLLVPVVLLAGCRNSCQQLCEDMADYALESCDLQFSQDEIDSCIADHARSEIDKDAVDACSTAAPHLEEEWDCQDLKDYFKGSAGE